MVGKPPQWFMNNRTKTYHMRCSHIMFNEINQNNSKFFRLSKNITLTQAFQNCDKKISFSKKQTLWNNK